MYVVGLFLSLIIGVVLGMVGGGGSILTVPLVNFFFGESMLIATTYSLFVVAVASTIGVFQRHKLEQVDYNKGVTFVIPSMLTAFAIRKWIMPMFPVEIPMQQFELSRDIVITVLLVIVMIYTALRTLLIKRGKVKEEKPTPMFIVGAYGVLTGMLSGFIGAGGGFIIVPILLRLGLDMRKAVGTSMFVISIQSFVALLGDFSNPEVHENGGINWGLLCLITLITVLGVLIGTKYQKKVTGTVLRKVFSVILLIVSVGLIIKIATNS